MKKTLVVFTPPKYQNEIWLPTLWSQAKTYYEKNGNNVDQWRWYPCYADTQISLDKIKEILEDAQPDIFAISLYVWNIDLALIVAEWVKARWPKCLVISGGPQQSLKYDMNWFKLHKFIDASLPGECYGELFFTELLENYNNGSIDWNKITDARYPREGSRLLSISNKTMQLQDKKQFDYQWSSFASQQTELMEFINYQKNVKILAILETTRGCPYGCTYCEWGGGILTSVRKKDLMHVEKDLKFLTSINLYHLFIADANLGIFGDRDLEIIQMLAKFRKINQRFFSVGYSGFAKTDNKIDTIRKIIKIDMENNFSYSKLVKLSIQSLDTEVLKNIDRKNIELDTQLTALQPLAKKNKYPIFIEMILGLPGMTLEKFYHELDVLGGYNLSAMWYEWLLLPETPAYDPKYMQQHCIKTVQRNNGWAHYEPSSKMNIVIETKSYSKENYLEMLLAVSIYHAIIQGGLYSGSINWIVKTHSIGLGQIIQEIYNRYYQDQFSKTWHDILDDPEKNCLFTIKEHQVFVGLYFGALAFLDPLFADSLKRLLIEKYNCPSKLLNKEQKKLININNSNKTFNEIINDFILSKSNILKRKTLFGRFYW